jgi:hypothetical protein
MAKNVLQVVGNTYKRIILLLALTSHKLNVYYFLVIIVFKHIILLLALSS